MASKHAFFTNEAVRDYLVSSAPTGHHVLLIGPPGTGKSRLAYLLAEKMGVSCFRSGAHSETLPMEIIGYDAPHNGEWVDYPGPLRLAWESGGYWLIDEIDRFPEAIGSLIQTACDAPEIANMILPGGRRTAPKPGFRCIATSNFDPDDINSPFPVFASAATRERFPIILYVGIPPQAAIRRAGPLAGLVEKGYEAIAHRRLFTPPMISLRAAIAFEDLRKVVPVEQAAQGIWGVSSPKILDHIRCAGVKL